MIEHMATLNSIGNRLIELDKDIENSLDYTAKESHKLANAINSAMNAINDARHVLINRANALHHEEMGM